MRTTRPIFVVALACTALAAGERVRQHTFLAESQGSLPKEWKADKTGKGEGSVWKVVADPTSPSKTGFVLAQTAEGPSAMFNLCVLSDSKYKDVELAVSFKTVKGKIDQGGGLVWRYQDANNYYVCRMNPLEDNFRVYKVQSGKRTQFASADAEVPAGEWHRIKTLHTGDHIQCYLDDKKLVDVKDSTFPEAGKIGVWTKADAQTYFDNLSVDAQGR